MSIKKTSLRNDEAVQHFYLELARDSRLWDQQRSQALQYICLRVRDTLNVSRVSIWSYKNDNLHCLNLYDTRSDTHSNDLVLARKDYPAYFAALDAGRVIDAHDAHSDPRTREFSENYLHPLGIGAMLDATLRHGGDTTGVLCLEHIGGPRLWSSEERALAIIVADLIGQVEAHHTLKNTVNHFNSLLNNMPSAAYRCDYSGKHTIRYISPGITKISGYDAEELIDNHSQCYADIILDSDKALVNNSIESAITHVHDFELEYRIRHKNDGVRWVSEYGRVVIDPVTEAVSLDGVINDITEQKLASEMRQHQQNIISEVSHGISATTGETFFKTLSCELTKVLQVSCGFISKISDTDDKMLDTIATYMNGEFVPDFSYEIAHSPCEKVLEKKTTLCFSSDVINTFPNDAFLREMAFESYLGTPLLDTDGKPLGVLGVLHNLPLDHTELAQELLQIFAIRASSELQRKIAEHALQDSQLHYQSLFESAGDAIFLLHDGIFTDCNPATLVMFGCERDDIIGHSPAEFSPPLQPDGQASQEKAVTKITAALRGITQHFDWQHIRLDGSTFAAEVTLNRVQFNHEYVLLATVRDVSESKRAEHEIKQQRNQLQAAIEAMPGIYYMFARDGSLVYSNKAYRRIFRKNRPELKNATGLFAVHPQDRELAETRFQHVLNSGETIEVEFRVISADEEVLWFRATGSRLILDGEPYLVGAGTNITERVETQKQLEVSQTALQQRNQILQVADALANKLHGLLDENAILNHTARSFAKLPGRPCVFISEVSGNEEDRSLNVVAAANLPGKISLGDLKPEYSGTVVERAFKEARLQIGSYSSSSNASNIVDTPIHLLNGQSEVCIPLFDNKRPHAAISIIYTAPHPFSSIDLNTLESMAKNAAGALVNASHAAALEHQARHDALTGLPNRSAIQEAISTSLKQRKKMALMLIDLDRFKDVNDTLGHNIGDKIICTIGPRIEAGLVSSDIVFGRLGGDEFALVIPADDTLTLLDQANHIIEAIRKPFVIDTITLDLNASIGIAIKDEGVDDEKELLRRADIAMYHAKQHGGGHCFYSDDIDTHSREKLAIMAQLREAISDNQFIFHYQPKIDIHAHRVVGVEALIRWQHPERGVLFPDAFIELVEMTDMIHALTQLVLKKAIEQLQVWAEQGCELTIAVNVSTRNLLDAEFPTMLEGMLRDSGVDPSRLEIEITENSLITDPERVRAILVAVAHLGVHISVDDFGTGYSSLAYLKRLPIHALKIDRTFIMDMENDQQDEMIVTSTVTLAHSLGLKVVAEGVETAEAAKKLIAMGCENAQGYYYSRPLPMEDFVNWQLENAD